MKQCELTIQTKLLFSPRPLGGRCTETDRDFNKVPRCRVRSRGTGETRRFLALGLQEDTRDTWFMDVPPCRTRDGRRTREDI